MSNSPLKFIITSGKGGVAKSSTATQVIAPFLYEQNKKQKIKYAEIDEVNNTAITYAQTEIMDMIQIKPSDEDGLMSLLIDQEPTVIDVGGGNTSLEVINAVEHMALSEGIIWVIPLSDGEEDAQKAMFTYNKIMEKIENPEVIFILTRTLSDSQESIKNQFPFVFGHPFLEIDFFLAEDIENFQDDTKDYAVFPSFEMFTISKILQKTIYEESSEEKYKELYDERTEVLKKQRELEDSQEKAKLNKELAILTKKISLNKKFQDYKKNTLSKVFAYLATKIYGKK